MGTLDINSLLRLDEGLVHSDVYSSPEVFELEIRKLFHEGWVYIGHESEIPRPGDFVRRWIGRQSVILNRDGQGRLHLFMNRCRHRALTVCQLDSGNTDRFQCAYHGWTYGDDGALLGVTQPQGYGDDFCRDNLALTSVRMEVYRGFVWGNLSQNGVSLDEHLGVNAKHAIDLFCDASPQGEIVLQQGCLKGASYGNWKLQGGDGYHPPVTHEANFFYFTRLRRGETGNPIGSTGQIEQGYISRDLGNGHVALDVRTSGQRSLHYPKDAPWFDKYRRDLIAAHGQNRAEFILRALGNPHTVFMPNLHLVNACDVTLVRPVRVDYFEAYFYCAFLKGVPDELNEYRLRDTETRMGAAGYINPDDVEMFERMQDGMKQIANPWKYMARGMNRERIDEDAATPEAYSWSGTTMAHYSDELTQRAQLRWWAKRLSE
jgi:phenylpropionate dioxygenase-like ring-hydroxylating dioxygenase large terminal subunit